MKEKRLKQFTFYDLYYEALKGLPNEAAGRMAKNICRFMFTNEEIPEPQDDREDFFWSNLKDVLKDVKRIEERGRKPKNLNEKMPHFTFTETYYKAIKLMTEAESGQYKKRRDRRRGYDKSDRKRRVLARRAFVRARGVEKQGREFADDSRKVLSRPRYNLLASREKMQKGLVVRRSVLF